MTNKQFEKVIRHSFNSRQVRIIVKEHKRIEFPELNACADGWIVSIEPRIVSNYFSAFYSVYTAYNNKSEFSWYDNFASLADATTALDNIL